ncbi:MAG: DUF1810 domain-containing protein [Ruminococcus sp.]|nr:DUF1810 domain-containing protein [Ruminococcus sp.]
MNSYDLSRFTDAHRQSFDRALSEIKNGRKQSHWMWYIFPQLKGLGSSVTSEFYGITDLNEAKAFLSDPYLGSNLTQICSVLLTLESINATEIFGSPDDMKLRSSMTLFDCASPDNPLFRQVLDKFYGGTPDYSTLRMLGLLPRK